MKVSIRKENAGALLSHEYFYFEKEIFGRRYKSCPTTYNEYKKYFSHDYIVVEIRVDKVLVGLLIADVLRHSEVYYIRLIAINEKFRGKNLCSLLLQEFFQYTKHGAYLVFVSEDCVIESIIKKFGHFTQVNPLPEPAKKAIYTYNEKLTCLRAHDVIKEYYNVHPNGTADAILFILRVNDAKDY